MRLRMFALLGSLALLAVLGAPTLAMSVREQLPTAPWQGARGPVAALSGRYHGWMQKAVTSERDYLVAMLANRRAAVAADLRLERSPRSEPRALGATAEAVSPPSWPGCSSGCSGGTRPARLTTRRPRTRRPGSWTGASCRR